jgi:hypothetical protein
MQEKNVDGRDKPGHDDVETERDDRDHPIALGSVQTEAIN